MKKVNVKCLECYKTPQMSEIALSTEQTILSTSPTGINFEFGGGFGEGGDLD